MAKSTRLSTEQSPFVNRSKDLTFDLAEIAALSVKSGGTYLPYNGPPLLKYTCIKEWNQPEHKMGKIARSKDVSTSCARCYSVPQGVHCRERSNGIRNLSPSREIPAPPVSIQPTR